MVYEDHGFSLSRIQQRYGVVLQDGLRDCDVHAIYVLASIDFKSLTVLR